MDGMARMTRSGRVACVSSTILACVGFSAGCDKNTASSGGGAKSGGSSVQAPSTPIAPPKPADAGDDALAPGCLPKSGAAGDWIKVAPIKTYSAAALIKTLPPELGARVATFGVKSAAACAYARPAGGRHCQADVLLIEATRVDDAYGLMTIQSSAPEAEIGGCLIRTETREGLHFHAWQGLNYVHVWSVDTDEAAAAAMRKLVQNIASRIQREEPPALLDALPQQNALPGRRWLVRSLTALPSDALGLSPRPDWAKLSEVLTLGPDTITAICQYDVPKGRRPDTVWVISYSSVEAARDAYARYIRHLEQDGSPASLSTNVSEPRGRFLAGTWTTEEESILYVLPRVMQLLPS